MAYTIAQVLVEPAPPSGAAYSHALTLYTELQTRLAEWNHVTSQSHEGESHTSDLAVQERQILTYYAAYKLALAAANAETAGADAPVNPLLLATPTGRRFRFDGLSLHQL